MSDKHLSTQFDAELSGISGRVLQMGGLVENQVSQALYALSRFSGETASQILQLEERVNAAEVDIDRELSSIIARRQPTARDLRLLIAVSKSIAHLERIGDEAARIARTVHRMINGGVSTRMRRPVADAGIAGNLAIELLRQALDALARLDTAAALEVLKRDHALDIEFESQMRRLVTYMVEDPRTISASIDLVFVAKALERIGDHAKNLAEQVIYVVKGADVRHVPMGDVESVVG
jgi:phosphate transport system protein